MLSETSSIDTRGLQGPRRDPGRVTTALRKTLTVFALALATTLAFLPLVSSTPAEAAITNGPQLSGAYGPIGGFVETTTGYVIYCVTTSADWPAGQTFPGAGNTVTTIPAWPGGGAPVAVTGDQLGRMNSIAVRHGQTADAVQAAAVHIALLSYVKGDVATAKSYIGYADGYAAQVSALVDQYLAEANATQVGGVGSGSATLTFQTDHTNNYKGTLTVSNVSPANAVGTITLANGVFSDTGSSTISGVTNGAVLNIIGTPGEDDVLYKIGATGVFEATAGWPNSIQMMDYSASGQQFMVFGNGNRTPVRFTVEALDPQTRSTVFQPAAATQVPTVGVEAGDVFRDVITFSTVADASGVANPWRQAANGQYLPVVAGITVYGPFTDRPIQSTDAPAGAPIADYFEITTSVTDGPTVDYPVEGITPLPEAGYYTAVVNIDYAKQSAANPPVQRFLPDGYSFKDDFGQLVETSIVPFSIDFTTALSSNAGVIGDSVTDRINPRLTGGAWLRDGGSRVPVEIQQTWYYYPTTPAQQATAPADAEVLQVQNSTLSGPGVVLESPLTQMPYREGFVTVQTCALESVYVSAFCDDWGVPSETIQLDGPEVTTTAQPTGVPTDTVIDTAHVVGPVPASGLDLTFAGYLQPEDATEPVCTPDTQIYSSTAPIRVTAEGDFPSEQFPVLPEHVGKVFWIERTLVPGTDIVVTEGECGLPNETTVISWPTVSSLASVGGSVGGSVTDSVIVEGLVPTNGMEVTFAGYLQPEDATEPVCTPDTQVFESEDVLLATGAGTYTSEEFLVTETEIGKIYWIDTATISDDDGNVVWENVGECGLPNETTYTLKVTTLATSSVHTGGQAHDTALIEGVIPDVDTTGIRTELTFEAFVAGGGECTADEREFTTEDAPIVIQKPGEYTSASTTFSTAGDRYWVETVTFINVETEQIVKVHVGKCGLPNETTKVTSPPPLALTGAVTPVAIIWLAGGMLLVGVVALLIVRRRMTVSNGK